MAEVLVLGPILSFVLLVLLVAIGLRFVGSVFWLLVNSLIGVIALAILNLAPVVDIPINIWTVLIAAIGGIPGIILLLLLDVFGILI
ncbi:MAG: pro-sigmaK processing inhibitor BofA family protein [Candidatus Diapherotrites archaeon]|nr:pro-sigmaK processing inhibitor BofA family protein [Candidatus Diapherotrites archaeon]MDZ4256919.1 pro-sigmaK processing inhibitor BofA family protein [archaeon]